MTQVKKIIVKKKKQKNTHGSYMELRVGNKYKLVRKIGGGSFGDIYLGVNITNGEEFAVKKKKKSFNEQTTLKMQTHLFLSFSFFNFLKIFCR